MFSKRGLILSLHASLADQGLEVGSNSKPTSQWYDLSGKGNHGILNGFQFTKNDGWVGKNTLAQPYALFFNGTSQYIQCTGADTSKPITSITFEVWIYYIGGNVVLSSGGQLDNTEGNDTQGILVKFSPTGELELQIATSTRKAYANLGRLPRNQWYHIVGAYDEITGNLATFLNGAPQGNVQAEFAEHSEGPNGLFIGKQNTENSQGFRGYIPVVRMYNVALTMDEIVENYMAGYLLGINHSDMRIHAIVPERQNLTASLQVGISTEAQGKQTIIPADTADMSSYIAVRRPIDVVSNMHINTHVSVTSHYVIHPKDQDDVQSAIEVKVADNLAAVLGVNASGKTAVKARYGILPADHSDVQGRMAVKVSNNLAAVLSVSSSSIAVARYDVKQLIPDDLLSSLDVVQQGLPSCMSVQVNTKLAAQYKVLAAQEQDFKAVIEVKQPNDLVSSLKINTQANGNGRYQVRRIESANLSSNLQIKSIYQIHSSLSVRTHTHLGVKYGIEPLGAGDLTSLLTVSNISKLHSSIQIGSHTRIIGHYHIHKSHVTDVYSSLKIKKTENLPSLLSISSCTQSTGRYRITSRSYDDLPSAMTVREVSDMTSSIGVTPYTWMKGRYDVIEPPTYTTIIYANKDAFVRESQPRLNYGVEEQMYVGYSASAQERYRSYVGFDLDTASIPEKNTTIKSAELKVYFDGRNVPLKGIQLIEASKEWSEYGVTWQNQPFPFGFNSPDSTYNGINIVQDVGGDSGYISFDVTDSIRPWYEGKRPNFGYIFKALDEFENGSIRFFTKEQKSYRPILVINYYDTRIYSLGRNSIEGGLTTRVSKGSQLKGSLRIKQSYGATVWKGSLFVHNQREILADITVTVPNVNGKVSVRRKDNHSLEAQLVVAVAREHSIDSAIWVNRKIIPSNMYVFYRENIASRLSVARWAAPFPELPAKILVNRKETLGSIHVRRIAHQDITSGMELSIPNILGSLTIFQGAVKKSSISVRRSREADLMVEGHILDRQDMLADMNIHNPDFYGRLQIVFSNQLISDLSVRTRAHSGLPSTVTIPHHTSLRSSIAIWPKKDVPSSLTVLSGNLWASISIPYHKRMDMQSRITVRAKLISDLEIAVGVRSGNLGSNIKVQVDSRTDQSSHLRIRRSLLDSILSELYVKTWEKSELKGKISARKSRESDRWFRISVRLSDQQDWDSELSVRVMEHHDLNSEVGIRRDVAYDQYSHVTIRHSEQTELPADLGIREHSHITGYLTVRRTAQKSLQSGMNVWEKSVVTGSVVVRQYRQNDLHSSMDIWKRSIMKGHISVWQKSLLSGAIQVQIYDDVTSSIEVATEYGYCYIM
ncbi:DNRLRE domain-containing protein [Paenibacillus kribbensis]|uniref:DNRLRE domain-containing protein n=1 Tax=Paenibacillus kribbensis TaxID=172713 RepID=UPI000838CEDB|nr:DNRLRE domain-containing protein [Paenibacillus kribbensis]